MAQTTLITAKQEWQHAWNISDFRRKVITGLIVVTAILSLLPFFFQRIEQRHGILLNDPLLRWLPAYSISVPLFIVIWAITILSIVRAVRNPWMFLNFLWAFIVMSIFRVLTITLVPLDPPAGLIGLVDPLSNAFYGDKFITKDLFFSGHTASVFLLYLCLPGRLDKRLALLGTFCVAFLLLVQHVHYTLDVLGGFVFAWVSYRIANRLIVVGPEPAHTTAG